MTAEELGDNLARLVWESFTDFFADEEAEALLSQHGLVDEDGIPKGKAAEEVLIFFMWTHTRGAQLGFNGRASDELIRLGLDALHTAVFEDMVEHGTPSSQLPLFEQHVSTRYSEYNVAAAASDAAVGRALVSYLPGSEVELLANAVTERAVIIANPLRDFLQDVDLVH
jgi:hypothetical protein